MQLDAYVLGRDLSSLRDEAGRLEEAGHGGLWSVEANHDPFLPLVVAATGTSNIQLGTNVAVAFARNPMTVALTAHELQRLSNGRFVLGLGPQVRAHIERRFSMRWSHPAARMKEFVRALRAIWATWETGEPLSFEGEFYRHDLMAPNFDPGPTGFGPPPVYLGAVGPRMIEVAAEVADGILCHPLTTPAYLSTVLLPTLDRSRGAHGRSDGFSVVVAPLAASGPDERAIAAAAENVRTKIAFYASTPAYRPVLDVHGLGELQSTLNALARQGRWSDMASGVDDDVLRTFALVGTPSDIGYELVGRYAGLADRAAIYELDDVGRLLMDGRYLTEPDSVRLLMSAFHDAVNRKVPKSDSGSAPTA